ncbi:MAG TPA: nuclear transport factor 2 family protein [Thermoleophilaceae bacterium]|nr:nuclear transport factor 2 family protein [Thermoleophilaceae bacterium]
MTDEEIIDRVRTGYEAFNRGDFDSAVALLHPDVEYIPVGGQPPIRGADQIRAWMEPSAFERQVIEPRDIVVHGDKILLLLHSEIRGAGSGIEMEVDAWTVMTQDSDGLVTRMETFFLHDEAEARAAAGLGTRESG